MRSDKDIHDFLRSFAFLLAATAAIVALIAIGVLLLVIRAIVGGA
jgi:hypothetical protein